MDQIRQAILDEFKPLIPVKVNAIKGKMALKVYELHDKEVFREMTSYGGNWKNEKVGYYAALKSLYGLEERSPYLLYTLLELDEQKGKGKWSEVLRWIPMKILEPGLPTVEDEEEQEAYPFKVALQYFCDAAKGAQF